MSSFTSSSGFNPNTPLISKDGTISASEAFADCDAIGIYFSAHWCPPCRGFTPVLCDRYNALKEAGKKVEIVFASSDRDQKAFDEYFAEMPFLAIPFSNRSLKSALSDQYGVQGIPTLIFFHPKTGKLITKNGRKEVSDSLFIQNFPYEPYVPPPKEEWPSINFPQRHCISFEGDKTSMDAMKNAIIQASKIVFSDKNEENMIIIQDEVLNILQDPTTYHSSKMSKSAVPLVVDTAIGKFGSPKEIFPFVDLLRCCTLHQHFMEIFHTTMEYDIILGQLLNGAFEEGVKPIHTALMFQVICNLLSNHLTLKPTLKFLKEKMYQSEHLNGNNEKRFSNKHVMNTLAVLLLNVSVQIFRNDVDETGVELNDSICLDTVNLAKKLMKNSSDKAKKYLASGKIGKSQIYLNISKKFYTTIQTCRIRMGNFDNNNEFKEEMNILTAIILELDSSWSDFVNIAESTVMVYEGKRMNKESKE
jgi:thiol-disulfide isomerase/thioredoxin